MSERVYCPRCEHLGYVMRPESNRRKCYVCNHVFSDIDGRSLDEIAPRNCGSSARTVESVTTSLPPEKPGTPWVRTHGNATWTTDELYELWEKL